MFLTKARNWLWCVLVLVVAGCSTFSKDSSQANSYLQSGDYNKAIEVLKPLAEKDSDDQLVYLLDYGMALHVAGRYAESIQVFLKADAIAAIKDYSSLSRIAGSVLLNEGMVQYRGDDFEKVFIHVYLALDFLMENNLDDALVEARRVNEILQKYRQEAKRNYDQNGFANYISGAMWEADHKWDDAYISYKYAFNQLGDKKILRKDLVRSAKEAQRDGDLANWLAKFKDVNKSDATAHVNQAELIFIYQQGKGPIKRPNPNFPRIPKLFPQGSAGQRARVFVSNHASVDTEEIYSVSDVAIKTLDDQYAALIAKRVVGIATKYVISDQLSKKSPILGFAAWVGLNAVDQADLRQWSNLPETFQVARVWLAPGEYEVSAQTLDSSRELLNEKMKTVKIKVKAKEKAFLTWRSFH